MNKTELTTTALNKLEFHTGLVARVIEPALREGRRLDAIIQFNNSQAKLVAELKKWGADADVPALIEQITAVTGARDKIVISDYIADDVGARLREAKVNYLDHAGNAYLDITPIYVLIQGKTPKEKVMFDKATNRLFTETGLKVVFALLSNPGLLNASYRNIADHADVSMGAIGWVLRELKTQGYTLETERTQKWKKRSELIKKWTEEYPVLKVKNQLGSFYCQDKNWWKTIDMKQYDAVLGAEIAAINYVDTIESRTEPGTSVVYVGKGKHLSLIRDLNLVDVTDNAMECKAANIEIRSRFWGQSEDLSMAHKLTHPLVAYADLLDTWDPVNRDIAGQIADKYLHN